MAAMRAHEAGALHAEGYGGPPQWLPYPADVNSLLPTLWSRNVTRNDDGELTVAGVGATALAAQYGTPVYVVDEDDFRSRARDFADAFAAATASYSGATVSYAGKAFLCTDVARWVREEGLHLDVCSAGELETALRAGVEPGILTLHGNNKSLALLRRAISVGVGCIVVDSTDEIARLHLLARELRVRVPVMIRVTVGIEAHTHEYIATAHEDQKFGLSLAGGQATRAVASVLADPESFELLGLHSHIGSQIFSTEGFSAACLRIMGLLAEIRDAHGVELPRINVGGGFGMAYTSAHTPRQPSELAAELIDAVAREAHRRGLRVPHLMVEPGRAIAGPSTFTLYEIGTIKEVYLAKGTIRTYVAVDGGMSDNIRTALYEADYSASLANRKGINVPRLVRIVGGHCESGDVVVLDEYLPANIALGDLVAVPGTGAYCRAMSNQYNHTPRPPVVAVKNGASRVLIRRETIDDILAFDAGA